MMFSTAFRYSRIIISIVFALAIVATAAVGTTTPAGAQVINPAQLCTDNGGNWNGITCSGLAPHINCIVFTELGLSLPTQCSTDTTPTDFCSTVEGVQTEEEPCPTQEELDCEAAEGTWDEETSICTPASTDDEDEGEETTGGSSSGGSSSRGGGLTGGGSMGGLVLGATTDEVCADPLITTYMGQGKQNDLADVVRLQMFLNAHLGLTVPVTGVFGTDTKAAVEQFQVAHADEVLAPWVPFGLASAATPTGYVYKTTKRMINKIHCASLDIPMPELP